MQHKPIQNSLFSKDNIFMKLLYATLVSLLFTTTLFSQQKKLLQNFKYRIDNFTAVNLNLQGNVGEADGGIYHSDNNRFGNTYLGGSLLKIKSTDNNKLNLFVSMVGGTGVNKTNETNTYNKATGIAGASNCTADNTWYKKGAFFQLATQLSGNFSGIKNKNIFGQALEKKKNNFSNIAVTIGFGKGRLENVTDMQNALWLYKVLLADKNLKRELTDDELNNLGKSITKGNNTRVLDFRRRIKFLLKTVDKFLQEKGVVNNTNIDYFNNLNDILFYAINNQRLAGTEIFARFNPQLLSENQNNFTYINSKKDEGLFSAKILNFKAGFQKYLPQSLIHQNNFGAAIVLNYLVNDNTTRGFLNSQLAYDIKFQNKVRQAGVELFFEHAMYPNTRTNINFAAKTSFGLQDAPDLIKRYAAVEVKATTSYFISYRTRFFVNLGVNYINNKSILDRFYLTLPNRFLAVGNVGIDVNL